MKMQRDGQPTLNDFLPSPPRIQLNQGPNPIILSHTWFGTSAERYYNFGKII